MEKCLLLLVFFLITQSNLAVGQRDISRQKITLSFESISLEQLLDFLEKNHNLNFSYSIDNTPITKEISIHAYEMHIKLFLEMLCFKAGLTYHIIDDQIVLRQKTDRGNMPGGQLWDSDQTNVPGRPGIAMQKELNDTIISIKNTELNPDEKIKPIPPMDSGRRMSSTTPSFSINGLSSTPYYYSHRLTHNFRQKKMASLAIGLMASYDYLKVKFEARPNKNQKFSLGRNFSIGVVGIISPGEIFSGTISFLYTTKNYFLTYNYELNNSKDPFPFPDKTKVYLSYLELPIDLNYRFLKGGRFSLYLSAGITTEFLIRESESTSYQNGKLEETIIFKGENNNFLLGGSIGLVLWYNLNKSFSIFFKPDGVHYFTTINSTNMRSRPQLLKLKTGMSIRLTQ